MVCALMAKRAIDKNCTQSFALTSKFMNRVALL